MTYSDDYVSPTSSPFAGDEDGDIFDTPDLVWDSPETTERVVDTQSGFLVVIRRIDDRLSLSVKRRLGTPPVSQIILTAEESVQLSVILAAPIPTSQKMAAVAAASPAVSEWLETLDKDIDEYKTHKSRQSGNYPAQPQVTPQSPNYQNSDSKSADSRHQSSEADHHRPHARLQGRPSRVARAVAKSKEIKFTHRHKIIALVTVLTLGSLAALFLGIKGLIDSGPQAGQAAATAKAPQQLDTLEVDKFVRTFVANMLDFNPASYRVSQVQAMAAMAPELMEKYWDETNFPISLRKLKALPQGQTLMITRVTQEKVDTKTNSVDIFADLVSADTKSKTPVHLKVKVTQERDGLLKVLEQKDLSSSPG